MLLWHIVMWYLCMRFFLIVWTNILKKNIYVPVCDWNRRVWEPGLWDGCVSETGVWLRPACVSPVCETGVWARPVWARDRCVSETGMWARPMPSETGVGDLCGRETRCMTHVQKSLVCEKDRCMSRGLYVSEAGVGEIPGVWLRPVWERDRCGRETRCTKKIHLFCISLKIILCYR